MGTVALFNQFELHVFEHCAVDVGGKGRATERSSEIHGSCQLDASSELVHAINAHTASDYGRDYSHFNGKTGFHIIVRQNSELSIL